ncbi:hypothetical protein VTI74DRAFT_3198 [Chaetomium olivicolor]
MEYWPKKGRPMLIAALEAVCDAVEDDLASELQHRDDSRHASLLEEISQLRASAARTEQLENENQSLLREIEQLRRKHVQNDEVLQPPNVASGASGTRTPIARPALAGISTNHKIRSLDAEPSNCGPEVKPNYEREYSKLLKKYAALEARYEENQRKGRQFREARDNWVKYAQSLEAKIKKLDKKLQRKENPDGLRRGEPQPVATTAGDALSGQTALGSSFTSDPGSDSGDQPHEDAVEETTSGRITTTIPATVMSEHAGRSPGEETEDGSEEADELPPLPPSTPANPVVTIKQEPSSNGPIIVSERPVRKRKYAEHDGGEPTPPRKIKTEHSSSSDPIVTGEAPIFCPHESIDLDEEELGMPTPRKQRHAEQQQLRDQENMPSSDDPPLKLHHAASRSAKYFSSTPTPVLGTRPASSGLSTHRLARSDKDRRSPNKAGWTLAYGVAEVAEDSFEGFHSPRPNASKGSTLQTPAPGRLSSLLNIGSPTKTTFLPPTPLSREKFGSCFDKENIENMPLSEKPGHARNVSTKDSPAKGRPNAQNPGRRLRDRPMVELRPEDFKINPKFNNGYKHAFTEVVRNREERAELAGCTDPNCCGRHFRPMAESELRAGGPGILSRVADTKMMENYLGSEAYKLGEMTRKERQEVWIKAKVQDLANRYGRHRHRFERRPSPPGYWNPDFPSTQEIEKRKEEGERMERRLVEDRWREAMRAGGRWLFRDE